jgi:hypothetical protein
MPRGAARDVNAEKKDDFTDREYCWAFLSLLVRACHAPSEIDEGKGEPF